MKLKCQNCTERATLHITEVEAEGYRDVHLCHKCAQKYLQEVEQETALGQAKPPSEAAEEEATAEAGGNKACGICLTTFRDFRKSGRLGCPNDYEVFREELQPLLENIHGGLRHLGKVPKRLPRDTRMQHRILQLRQEIQQAVAVEDYERAAQLRDEIDKLEKQP